MNKRTSRSSKPVPVDQKLYERIKQEVYKKNPQHSAYRSGTVVKKYKTEFYKRCPGKSPYRGQKKHTEGLSRWFLEDWRNQRGEVGYKYRSDIYRPTKRIARKTPKTFSELSQKRISTARKEKLSKGRVKRF